LKSEKEVDVLKTRELNSRSDALTHEINQIQLLMRKNNGDYDILKNEMERLRQNYQLSQQEVINLRNNSQNMEKIEI